MKGTWRQISPHRYVRCDGAVVKWDEDTPYSNPANPNARMWTVWEPDPGTRFLGKKIRGRQRSGSKVPRRYKTPEAAMAAADKAWPDMRT